MLKCNKLEDSLGSPERLSSVGIEGPNISVSSIPLRRFRRANARARFTVDFQKLTYGFPNMCGPAIVDFPTPPFAEDTAITFLTSLIVRRSGSPRCMRGMLPVRGNPL